MQQTQLKKGKHNSVAALQQLRRSSTVVTFRCLKKAPFALLFLRWPLAKIIGAV